MAYASTYPISQTNDRVLESSINGYYWYDFDPTTTTITWSISNGFYREYWTSPDQVYSALSSILAGYATYANIRFEYKGYYSTPSAAYSSGSNINVSLDGYYAFTSSPNTWAVGHFPSTLWENLYYGQAGDIYININSQANSLSSYAPGSAGWALLIHELGHTLGLKHPFDSGGTGRPTLSNLGLGDLDIDWFSVMSYNDDNSINLRQWDPASPMPLDIIGLQYLYGKNTTTHSGNTTHRPVASLNGYLSVWDSGGIDTIDYSTATTGYQIDLPDDLLSPTVGTYTGSALVKSELDAWRAGNDAAIKHLVWYLGDIENAIGSAYSDNLYGNHLANTLNGNAGDDRISGAEGNDVINGGLGTDTAAYRGILSEYIISYKSNSNSFTITDKISGRDDTDTLTGIEYFSFTDKTVSITDYNKDISESNIDSAQNSIIEIYIAYFNRAPDASGLSYWKDKMTVDNWDIAMVARSFMDAPEVSETYPYFLSNAEIVNKVYNNVLGRTADIEGARYWTLQLDMGYVSKSDLILAVINAAKSSTGSALDAAILANKTLVGKYFAVTKALDDAVLAKKAMSTVTTETNSVASAIKIIEDSYSIAKKSNIINEVKSELIYFSDEINSSMQLILSGKHEDIQTEYSIIL